MRDRSRGAGRSRLGGLVREGLACEYRFDEGQGQVLFDHSGYGNHATLGSTTDPDTNDPTWGPQGLTFTLDDYAISSAMSAAISLNGPFTLMLVAKFTGGSGYALTLASGDNDTCWAGIKVVSSGGVKPCTANAAGGEEIGGNIAVSTTLPNVLVFKMSGTGTRSLLRMDTAVSTSGSGRTGLTGTARAGIGVRGSLTPTSPVAAMVGYYLLGYNRLTSTAEDNRNLAYLRGVLARRGVVLP